MNIIIPIGGVGERFFKDGYSLPKPLVRSLGKHIIFWNIENLKTDENDVIHIAYRKDFDIYNFRDLINNKFGEKNIRYTPIENDTRGAAETVLYALNNMSIDELTETTLIVDSDNFYRDDIVGDSKKMEDNVIFYNVDTDKSPIFSYIKLDESGFVTEIKEKEKISDFACSGAYCFRSGSLLIEAIKKVLTNASKDRNEYYISDIYKDLILSGEKVSSKEISDFVCLGTPNQLKSFSSNFSEDKQKHRFCFDLDNTLVTYPTIKGDYSSVNPIQRNIDFCNFLNDLGHTTIVYTARRMRTHGGNVGAVVGDIAKVTIDTLERFKIKYDELYFGKPYAHFYIDDLAVKSFDDLEKETGFYNLHPAARNHNRIEIDGKSIVKYSQFIEGEKHFYENIPSDISCFFPELIDSGNNYIRITRLNGVPVSFLNTSKILNQKILFSILDSINKIHESDALQDIHSSLLYSNYQEKFKKRTNSYDFSLYKNFELIMSEIDSFLKEYEDKNRGVFRVIHGDPVFTNILIDNNDNLKFIDMRGKVGDHKTIFGDIFYDFSKVYQSIIGYDFVLMNKEIDRKYIEENKRIFKQFIVENFGLDRFEDIRMITKSLIVSLIPIHDNEKCSKYFDLINDV